MRLLTRSDFDGLACAVLLKKVGIIDSYKFVHPKDLQDGLVEVTENDCLANVPYVKGCGLWFDHHLSETERNAYNGVFKGASEHLKSCARVVYNYYGGEKTFPGLEEFIEGVDKVDSADLTIEDIKDPKGYVLLGFIMDPRTGLGRFRDFRISNYQLMELMIDWCATKSIDEILAEPDVKERLDLYFEQTKLFVEMVKAHTIEMGNTIVSDLRGVDPIYTGNRFMIYSLYPNANLSVWIVSGKGGEGCSAAVGYSVLNRTCKMNVGSLMLKYGGGGHMAVGTCQFKENMDENLKALLDDIKELNK